MTSTSTVYRQDGKASYWADLAKVSLNRDDGASLRRLSAHAEEIESRDMDRVDGQGGYFAAPYWAVDNYAALARPGRVTAELCTRMNLPPSTDSINVPKLLQGGLVDVQVSDNTKIAEQDPVDTFYNAPVRTLAGEISVALQLLDQSPVGLDQILFADLIADHAMRLDLQVLAGTGVSGQVLGILATPGIQSLTVTDLTIQGVYSTIAHAIEMVHAKRYLPASAVVMHPRRWSVLLAMLDDSSRPLFAPSSNAVNPAGLVNGVVSEGAAGVLHGLPVYLDPNIPTTAGATGDEDLILVARFSDQVLYEGQLRSRVLMEPGASTLTATCQVYSYFAYTSSRFPESVVVIEGFTAPQWV
jgi:HK97 family phage major capsid protein